MPLPWPSNKMQGTEQISATQQTNLTKPPGRVGMWRDFIRLSPMPAPKEALRRKFAAQNE
jgi:hypothetical protein